MSREYIEKSTRYKILKRQHFRCNQCGKPLKYNIHSEYGEEVAHIDHINPVSKPDGSYLGRLDNLQALCPECNIRKGNKEQFFCFQCGRPLIRDFLIDGKEREPVYICHHRGGCGMIFSPSQIEDPEIFNWYEKNWIPYEQVYRKYHPSKKEKKYDA